MYLNCCPEKACVRVMCGKDEELDVHRVDLIIIYPIPSLII